MNDENELLESNPFYKDFSTIEYGWIYIAVDMRDMSLCKIGLTTKGNPDRRIAEGRTYNPFLTLFTTYELGRRTFGISQKELSDIERYIHHKSIFGGSLKHIGSGRDSEWFQVRADYAEHQVDWILATRGFTVDKEGLFDYYESPNNKNGINVRVMRKIKKVIRPRPVDVWALVESAGYSGQRIKPYTDYLNEFHAPGNTNQVWL